ncbi:hypothetical protein GGX14DRAFT_451282 [Mycena pura]|uniref:DUF6534 domain-containing protein n=1 Tax=Mycena pura TaxID=153505 RepID=A0AAD6VE36_9AGAR|nr:hypothetical protein GGX14DRAFT_451282 [Mycena pura]
MASVAPHIALQVLESEIAAAVGPIFIANILNWMFMGTLVMQLYTYYQNYPSDRIAVRILVYTLFILDFAQTIMLTHHGWWCIVTSWGTSQVFSVLVWSAAMIPFMCGLIAGIVQVFYAFRIWRLAPNKFIRSVAILIVVLALTQSMTAMVTGIVLLHPPDVNNLIRLHPEFSTWLGTSLADDILITACMTYILAKAKKDTSWSASETLLASLINRVITTGAATAVCAAVDLGMFLGYPTTNYHVVPAYILGKFYTNSLMLTLNLRRPHVAKDNSDSLPMDSVKFANGTGMSRGRLHVQVDQATFSNADEAMAGYDTKWMPAVGGLCIYKRRRS